MSVCKHPDNLYKAQVRVGQKSVIKYAKTSKEIEKKNSELLNEAKNGGSYIFERKSRTTEGETVTSTMPLLSSDGAPRYLHIIKKVHDTKKKGRTVYYSIAFKLLGKNGGPRKSFSISSDGFEVAFKAVQDYVVAELELTRTQAAHWRSGKSVLKGKYQALKKAEESEN
jgi:hypothetical protein